MWVIGSNIHVREGGGSLSGGNAIDLAVTFDNFLPLQSKVVRIKLVGSVVVFWIVPVYPPLLQEQ